eukprot:jgi/Mesvir1/27718/Mv07420-RA.3
MNGSRGLVRRRTTAQVPSTGKRGRLMVQMALEAAAKATPPPKKAKPRSVPASDSTPYYVPPTPAPYPSMTFQNAYDRPSPEPRKQGARESIVPAGGEAQRDAARRMYGTTSAAVSPPPAIATSSPSPVRALRANEPSWVQQPSANISTTPAAPSTPTREGPSFFHPPLGSTHKGSEPALSSPRSPVVVYHRRNNAGGGHTIPGMTNLGNTCYLSAVLQVLTNLTSFVADLEACHAAAASHAGGAPSQGGGIQGAGGQGINGDSRAAEIGASRLSPSGGMSSGGMVKSSGGGNDGMGLMSARGSMGGPTGPVDVAASRGLGQGHADALVVPRGGRGEVGAQGGMGGSPFPDGSVFSALLYTVRQRNRVAAAQALGGAAQGSGQAGALQGVGMMTSASRVSAGALAAPLPGGACINPSRLKQSVTKHARKFGGARQQDAHEFFCECIDLVQEEVSQYLERPGKDTPRHPGGHPAVRMSDSMCPVTRNFSCFVEHELRCDGCGKTSTVRELFRNFSLDLSLRHNHSDHPESMSLNSLLQQFFADEHVERSCDECKCTSCTVRHHILRLPRVMVLHLKRFGMTAELATPATTNNNSNSSRNNNNTSSNAAPSSNPAAPTAGATTASGPNPPTPSAGNAATVPGAGNAPSGTPRAAVASGGAAMPGEGGMGAGGVTSGVTAGGIKNFYGNDSRRALRRAPPGSLVKRLERVSAQTSLDIAFACTKDTKLPVPFDARRAATARLQGALMASTGPSPAAPAGAAFAMIEDDTLDVPESHLGVVSRPLKGSRRICQPPRNPLLAEDDMDDISDGTDDISDGSGDGDSKRDFENGPYGRRGAQPQAVSAHDSAHKAAAPMAQATRGPVQAVKQIGLLASSSGGSATNELLAIKRQGGGDLAAQPGAARQLASSLASVGVQRGGGASASLGVRALRGRDAPTSQQGRGGRVAAPPWDTLMAETRKSAAEEEEQGNREVEDALLQQVLEQSAREHEEHLARMQALQAEEQRLLASVTAMETPQGVPASASTEEPLRGTLFGVLFAIE